jgi:putative DNA primase/helicase
MSSDDPDTVEFPKVQLSPEERARRLKVEVDRLAKLPEVEWRYYLFSKGVAEKYGLSPVDMKTMVEATIRVNEKKTREDKAEDRRRIRRVEKEKVSAQREQAREQAKQKREQEKVDKEAERKRKERTKAFEEIAKLPTLAHEARLAELAKRSGEDLGFLREEFAAYYVPADMDTKPIEPWDQPVDTHGLLIEILAQLRRYVVVQDDVAIAIALWLLCSWVHEVAVHSPLLIATSAEPDSGKSTLLGVLGFLAPRAYSAVELTGANVFRIVDLKKPTLLIDEADQLFRRKDALAEIVNAGWTKGSARIPRIVHGVIHEFDAFCPKVIGMLGLNLPSATADGAIVCMLWPKLPNEQVSDFRHVDDDDFTTLRRKLTRWAADTAMLLKDANPALPPGFSNRLAANWCLLLAIADVAGGRFPERARAAAVKLSHKHHQPSERLRLLAALYPIFATLEQIPSAELVAQLTADPDEEWVEFRGRDPITQRQVAELLAGYEIYPVVLHPTKRASLSRRGYRRSQFDDAFARFLPQQSEPAQSEHTNIRTPGSERETN